jgi:UDP-N-acetylglucosamine 3-dehydrogenase
MNDVSPDKIRIGIIGLGGIATRMHIPALSSMPEVKIVAGAEINPFQAERTQQRFGIPRIYTNYQEMLDVEQLDAVYVCLPSYLHYEAAKAALEKRLHVYCEKPMGISAGEARELVEAAETNQVLLMPGYQLRFNKNYQRGKDLCESWSVRRLGSKERLVLRFARQRGTVRSGLPPTRFTDVPVPA